MDLSNYTGLKAAIADYLNRVDLTTQIPGFIQLAEAEIARRVRRKTVRTSITIAQESTTLPADCAEPRAIHLLTSNRWQDMPLYVGTFEQLAETRASHSVAGRPTRAAMMGRQLLVAPEPDKSYQADLLYFAQITPLSASVSTNDVLLESPDAYLYGALKHSALFLEHDERIPVWSGFFDNALAQLEIVREREETNASLRPVRLPRRFG